MIVVCRFVCSTGVISWLQFLSVFDCSYYVRFCYYQHSPLPQVLVPSGIFDMDKLMAALTYQVDPQAVDVRTIQCLDQEKDKCPSSRCHAT